MAAVDLFRAFTNSLIASATRTFAITPHDTNELPFVTRAIHANTDGVVVGIFAEDSELSEPLAVVAGMDYAWRMKLVHTDTTAEIVGLF